MTKIVQILNSTGGGAGIAAVRLNDGLRALGYDSKIICQYNERNAAPAIEVTRAIASDDEAAEVDAWRQIDNKYMSGNRTQISNTLSSIGYPGFDISTLEEVVAADIIHLHWVPRLLSIRTIETILALDKPTFWTLHDYWPMTPGNHFPAGQVDQFGDGAGAAHFLRDDGFGRLLQLDKKHSFDYPNLNIVALSRQMQRNVKASTVFGERDCFIWYNAVDTDIFQPQTPATRAALRQELGIEQDSLVLFVAAQNVREMRKGFALLIQAVERHCNSEAGRKGPPITLLMLGANDLPIPSEAFQVLKMGTISDPQEISNLMNASDYLVHPATEEGFSLVILEALASGLPVVSFDNGGSPDVLVDGRNGLLLEGTPEIGTLQKALARVCQYDETHSEAMRGNARETALRYSPSKVARSMEEIYQQVVPQTKPATIEKERSVASGRRVVRLPIDPAPSDWLQQQMLPPLLGARHFDL